MRGPGPRFFSPAEPPISQQTTELKMPLHPYLQQLIDLAAAAGVPSYPDKSAIARKSGLPCPIITIDKVIRGAFGLEQGRVLR